MHYDVGSVLNRPDEVRCSESIVHNERDSVSVGDFRHAVEVRHIGVRIAECLRINHLGIRLYCFFQCLQVIDIHYAIADTLGCESVGDQVERAAVEVVGCDDVVA